MKRLSARGKKYFRFLLVIFTVVCFSAFLLPTFLFNEQEYKFRQEFYSAYKTLETVDYVISLRRSGPGQALTHDEFTQAGKDIEEGIEIALDHIRMAEELNEQQQSIPFLPKEYREYQKLKIESVQSYRENTKDFLQKKRSDHLLSDTTFLSYTTQDQIFKTQDPEQWWEAIQLVPERSFVIERQAEELYQSHYINESLYSYFMSQQKAATYLYEQALLVSETGDRAQYDMEGYGNFFEENMDVEKIFEESSQIGLRIAEKQAQKLSETFALIESANVYYNENHLAYDPLSKLLSHFSEDFPRMHFESSEKNLLPPDTDPTTVSLNLH